MGFLDSMKKSAARAQLEADKLVRINRVQSQIGDVRRQIRQRTLQLGEKSLDLYRAEKLSEPALVAICESIVALEKEIAEKEAQIEAIRQESVPEELVAVPATYGHLCPQCKISLPEEAVFCPNCGSRAVDVPPPTATTTAAACTNCGAMLLEGAMFCPQCGTKVEREPEVVEPAGATCPECQSPLPEGAMFCSNCGARVEVAEAPVPEDVAALEEEEEPEPAKPSGAVCPECQSPLPEGAAFCPECGTEVGAAEGSILEEEFTSEDRSSAGD